LHVPTITTDRLTLRPLRAGDLDAYAEMMADPEVTRFLADGKPLNRCDAWRHLALVIGHWELLGFGLWAVEENTTGAFLGRIGCFQPEGWPGFEIGYSLARHAWGKGYASEGAARSLEYARTELKKRDVISIIRPDNHRSARVATGLGATPGELVDFFGAPARIYHYPSQST
jgi:RimJ/RimL family protein N-acetyltransferase